LIRKGFIYTITIDDIGHKGEGVGKINGIPVFVDGGIPGDELKIRTTKVKKNYAFGELKEILKPSKDRVTPRCPLADSCGGCQIMQMDYTAQLKIKKNRVQETLKRIGKIHSPVFDVIGMEEPYEYRNKAQFPIGWKGNRPVMGFYRSGSHEIVDTNRCFIQDPVNNKLLSFMKGFILDYGLSVYDEHTGKGLLRHFITRVSQWNGDVMVIVVLNGQEIPHQETLIKEILQLEPKIKTIAVNRNLKKTNVIYGEETEVIYGEGYIVDRLGEREFMISPRSFFQVNSIQTEVLYKTALDYCDLTGEETVIDLYCGIGTISLFLTEKAKKVYGIEIVPEAIEDAKRNCRLNGIENAEFLLGKAEEEAPKLFEQGVSADVVVVDPPRKGCEEKVLETIVEMEPKKIVYVSCNPSTLARDLEILEGKGYETKRVQPVDLFCHSAHIETVTLLTKRG